MQDSFPAMEYEALLERATTQFILGDADATAAALAALSEMGATGGAGLAKELEGLALAQAASAVKWESSEERSQFESGLRQLREVLLGTVLLGMAPVAVPQAAPPAAYRQSSALNQDPELVGDFVLESREHLQTVEGGLLVLEKEPTNQDTLNAVFRSFHTIKGLAGFLEFAGIQAVAHEVETILHLARTEELLMTPNLIDLTLESADYLGQEINRIEGELHGQPLGSYGPPPDSTALLARVKAVILKAGMFSGEAANEEANEAAGIVEQAVVTVPLKLVEAPALMMPPDPPVEPVLKLKAVEAVAADPKNKRGAAQDTHAIRVDTAKLDYLLDMVGEMVIAESMVRLDPDLNAAKNTRLQRNLNQLRRVTEEVQKVAMATRLIPVGTLFQRVNRLVRDTSRKANKMAEVELVGEDTQLDKNIIEELTDPIMHMVRNSIDHGIESPADRKLAGKPESGKIQLKAYRQADHIQIEIADDGRGLNKDKILAKARERGLTAENAILPDSEIFQLIFEPGFSTAEKVTDISGRGVGMDVVKKQIQKLRGKIEIQSRTGIGTTFYLKLPLTLAIVEGLVVGIGIERYILPIYSVQEMFRPSEGQVSTVQGKGEMVMVRDQLLPLIRLHRTLGVRAKRELPIETLMIVAEIEGRRFVLMVDEFIGKQEVVIKNLGASLKNTPGIAGGAILGDGRVGLILDLEAIYLERGARPGEIKESVLIAC